MAVIKPDVTKFDEANDSISLSRPELEQLVTSFNTIADDYNAGILGGGTVMSIMTGDTSVNSNFGDPGTTGVSLDFNSITDDQNLVDTEDSATDLINTFTLAAGTYYIDCEVYGTLGTLIGSNAEHLSSSEFAFELKTGSTVLAARQGVSSSETNFRIQHLLVSTGQSLEFFLTFSKTQETFTFQEQGTNGPCVRAHIYKLL